MVWSLAEMVALFGICRPLITCTSRRPNLTSVTIFVCTVPYRLFMVRFRPSLTCWSWRVASVSPNVVNKATKFTSSSESSWTKGAFYFNQVTDFSNPKLSNFIYLFNIFIHCIILHFFLIPFHFYPWSQFTIFFPSLFYPWLVFHSSKLVHPLYWWAPKERT